MADVQRIATNMAARKKKAQRQKAISEFLTGYTFLLPMIGIVAVFILGPLLYAMYLSFFKVDLLAETSRFVGMNNFSNISNDERAWIALKNTVEYVVIVVPSQTLLALCLAAMMNSAIRFKSFFRTIILLPTVTSSAVLSLIFMWIYNKNGLLNHFLVQLGLPAYDWLGNPEIALKSIMIMNIWATAGWFMVIYLAALQDIPDSVYEAANIDGADWFQKFRKITIPMLKPVTIFVVVMGIIGTFQLFDQAYIFSGGDGGPNNSTLTLVLLVYQYAFQRLNFGYASALAIMLFLVIVAATLIQRKIMGSENNM